MPNWLSCKLGRYEYAVWCEDGAMFLRCSNCGRRRGLFLFEVASAREVCNLTSTFGTCFALSLVLRCRRTPRGELTETRQLNGKQPPARWGNGREIPICARLETGINIADINGDVLSQSKPRARPSLPESRASNVGLDQLSPGRTT